LRNYSIEAKARRNVSRIRTRGWKAIGAGAGLCLGSVVVWALCAETPFRLAKIDVATQFRVSKVLFDPNHPSNARAIAGYLQAHDRELELYRPHALQPAAPSR